MKLLTNLIDLETEYLSESLKISSFNFHRDMFGKEMKFFNVLKDYLHRANEMQANATNLEYRSQVLKTIKYAFKYLTVDNFKQNEQSLFSIIDYCLDNVNYFNCVDVITKNKPICICLG